ncbi:uncharacterized protein K460DRAFT_361025 [Cucurbitaria berberidis CBS 394.84]|uniref:MYND-type domain-containing protein n=1 Tax=Cucurbitaria berberidis CBS 394.84 TaxID=1168544 RepID=A0A9P4GPE6_9PLEO|nr:uncharacterized protein K460DRAFT_361025 [Cucurbitaria berberidis CBS 394.84]KAF1850198.1 hypothetical protein K460DRAFT_361025 [Cucurbitaria berberidis CBS 394.84]
MPPRSVCLNVFTTSLGDTAVRDDGSLNNGIPGGMERRDSAQSDIPRRSSSGSIASAPAPQWTPPISAINRAEMFNTLRPMASTESMNMALSSKPCSTCSGQPARRRCSRCKSAYYCDRNCQKSHWKTHRNACEPVTQSYSAPATPNVSTPTSPSNDS